MLGTQSSCADCVCAARGIHVAKLRESAHAREPGLAEFRALALQADEGRNG